MESRSRGLSADHQPSLHPLHPEAGQFHPSISQSIHLIWTPFSLSVILFPFSYYSISLALVLFMAYPSEIIIFFTV